MTNEIKQNLIKIKEVADQILEEHENSTVRFGGINYADLRIVDVSYNLHLDGEEDYSVLIEECRVRNKDFYNFLNLIHSNANPQDMLKGNYYD